MSRFNASVDFYMQTPVFGVAPDAEIAEGYARLMGRRVSALAVVSAGGKLWGVLTLTDLLRHGRRQAGRSPRANVLTFPKKLVEEVMTPDVISLPRRAPLRDAAKRMLEHRVHRIFVVDGERAIGVVSTKEVLRAVFEERIKTPLSEAMSASVFMVRAADPLSLAVERLEQARVTGLCVVDDDEWPVGVFTQREALESADLPRTESTENVMSPAVLCLRDTTPLYRAASQAAALDVRRIVVTKDDRPVGIVSGLDLARAAK